MKEATPTPHHPPILSPSRPPPLTPHPPHSEGRHGAINCCDTSQLRVCWKTASGERLLAAALRDSRDGPALKYWDASQDRGRKKEKKKSLSAAAVTLPGLTMPPLHTAHTLKKRGGFISCCSLSHSLSPSLSFISADTIVHCHRF